MRVHTMLKLALAAVVTLIGMQMPPLAGAADGEPVKLQSLREGTPLNQDNAPTASHQERDQAPLPRDFVQQPPLVPHTTAGYQITKNFNKCMDCHAWSKTAASGATKIGITHFRTREGRELDNISPLRYFCTQCHVPQADIKPLVENTFRPVEAIKPSAR